MNDEIILLSNMEKKMKPIEYTDVELKERTQQIQNDYERLYPNGEKDNPLYEGLMYHLYLCKKRNVKY